MAMHGEIVRLDPAHDFGFIRDDGHGDWFFVGAGVPQGGLAAVWVGERVAFDQEWTPQGPRATAIRPESAA